MPQNFQHAKKKTLDYIKKRVVSRKFSEYYELKEFPLCTLPIFV